jgi:hypothetical protein
MQMELIRRSIHYGKYRLVSIAAGIYYQKKTLTEYQIEHNLIILLFLLRSMNSNEIVIILHLRYTCFSPHRIRRLGNKDV